MTSKRLEKGVIFICGKMTVIPVELQIGNSKTNV